MKLSPFLTAAAAIAMAALFTFCGSSSENENQSSVDPEPVKLIITEVMAVEEGCDTTSECTRARFRMPVIDGGTPEVTNRINNDVEAVIREHIKSRLPEPMAMGSFSELADAFLEGYSLFASEFPDNPGKWFFEIQGDSSVLGEEYFMLRLRFDEFMGGAHPNSFTLLQNYRLEDGVQVNVGDIVDLEELKVRAEAAFRQKHEIGEGQSLNDGGLMFEDDVFVLPENMAIANEEILLIYNPYEVASYSTGYTIIRLPWVQKLPA